MNRYWAHGLTGGTAGYLDAIDPLDTDTKGTALADGDFCDVMESDMVSVYIAHESAGQVENDPDIIIPDTNPGNWYWELVERYPQDEGPVTALLYANTAGAF
jgi:hypothetical protein